MRQHGRREGKNYLPNISHSELNDRVSLGGPVVKTLQGGWFWSLVKDLTCLMVWHDQKIRNRNLKRKINDRCIPSKRYSWGVRHVNNLKVSE